MKYTKESLELTQEISKEINEQTFHHHYHVLYDIATSYESSQIITYVEIGCYAGGSACLLLQRPNTTVVSIDLGTPILPEVVHQNVLKLNKFNNKHVYLQGNSQNTEMVDRLKSHTKEVDILFIDGDHSYQGVINDFLLYNDLVKSGGYIVFDDYNDWEHSPEVKPAVNNLIDSYKSQFEIIGTIKNLYNARPASYTDGNVFIIRKL